jgi:hypothetical protein
MVALIAELNALTRRETSMHRTANLPLLPALVLIAIYCLAIPRPSPAAAPQSEGTETMNESKPKKGVCHWATGEPGHDLDASVIDDLGCAWFYNWTPCRRPRERKVAAEFVPMIWDETSVTHEILADVKAGGYSALLGFNEPDSSGQADMSVELAIELWPRLMETGLRLGSPATCQGAKWLDEFMEEADRRGYRVDFICLHWYGDITAPDAVDGLRRYLTSYWEKYHRPIWLTEYSGANWKWCTRRPVTLDDNARFARESVAMMESLPFIERYAWYSTTLTPSDRYYATTGLYQTADEITVVGEAYRDADKKANSTGS